MAVVPIQAPEPNEKTKAANLLRGGGRGVMEERLRGVKVWRVGVLGS